MSKILYMRVIPVKTHYRPNYWGALILAACVGFWIFLGYMLTHLGGAY